MVDESTVSAQSQEITELGGLTAPQQTRLHMYARNLSTDKDPQWHDNRMVAYLEEIVLDPAVLRENMEYLNSIGWNQSKYDYSQIEEQIRRFTLPNHTWFGWNKNYKTALKRFIEEATSYNLQTLDYDSKDDIQEWISKDDAHAGWSYIITGLKKKGEYRGNLLHDFREEVKKARRRGSFGKRVLSGTRTQASSPYDTLTGERLYEYKDKSRLVNMVDIYLVLAETIFAGPFQKKIGELRWYAGGKSNTVQKNIILMMRAKFLKGWISIDYSKYDQSISNWLIRDAFKVVRAAFSKDKRFDEELFEIIQKDFIYKTIIDGEKRERKSEKGVPSGSMFTQIIDSVVNRLMIDTYFESKGKSTRYYQLFIMGDDNLIYYTGDEDAQAILEDMEGYLGRNFGIEMNASKSGFGSISEDPEFLSSYWTMRGKWRHPLVLLAKLVKPERFRDYDKGCDPAIIVASYLEEYPLGMAQLIDIDKQEKLSMDYIKKHGGEQFASGLTRYKLRYAA